MANLNEKVTENVAGRYYVDSQCIGCNLCCDMAPANFLYEEAGGYAYVGKQPANEEEEDQCSEAMTSCPVEAIGDDGDD